MATAEPEPKLPECVPPLYGDIPDKTPPEKSQPGPDLVDVEQVYLTWQWNQVDGDKPKRGGGDHRGETWATERRRLAADTIMPGEGTKTKKGAANAIDREKPYNQYVLTGIGLSGGGIRSSTFCLGVLQAFAAKNLLMNFDYVSSVSGGGYLAASLRWWWSADPNSGTGPSDFPFGTEEPDRDKRGSSPATTNSQRQRLTFLRTHGSYLAPGDGISYFSGLVAVLRTMLLNLFVWIPTCAAFLALLIGISGLLNDFAKEVGLPNPLKAIVNASWDDAPGSATCTIPVVFALLAWVVIALALVFVLCAFGYGFASARSHDFTPHPIAPWRRLLWSIIFLVLAVAVFWQSGNPFKDSGTVDQNLGLGFGVFLVIVALLPAINLWVARKRDSAVDEAYHARRWFEVRFGRLFPFFIMGILVSILPVVSSILLNSGPNSIFGAGTYGSAGMLAGLAAAFRGQYAAAKSLSPTLADRIFLPLGGAILLFSTLVLSYVMGLAVLHPIDVLGTAFHPFFRPALLALIFIALMMSLLANINQIGLHRYYRDRVMETFMPPVADTGAVIPSPDADHFKLYDAWPHDSGSSGTKQTSKTYRELPLSKVQSPHNLPYPIINTNAVMIRDRNRKVATRGGANYILSPMYCGSSSTGWVRTQHPLCCKLTLASAMAASGAAANSNSGYVGGGLTRNTLISIAMMLLNIRLGYWVPNHNDHNRTRRNFWHNPEHWYPGFSYGVMGGGYRSDSGFLELSDGGHFENLGLYELIRRRCRVILICDGEADKQTEYLAFVSAIRRIEEDFGATVEFIDDKGPERLVADQPMGYPLDAKHSKSPYLVARVTYDDNTYGTIIYIKASIVAESSFKVKGYKGANPDFPNETTADQFFDPVQFEAYREMGYRAAVLAITRIDISQDNILDWRKIWNNAHQPRA